MTDLIPGTALAKSLQTGESAFAAIEPILTATGGLTLAQVEGLTGLNGSTIQNWVKRAGRRAGGQALRSQAIDADYPDQHAAGCDEAGKHHRHYALYQWQRGG